MKLSDITLFVGNLKVVRDAEFNQLGMATSDYSNFGVLTFLNNVKYSDLLKDNKSVSCVVTTKDLVEKFIDTKLGIVVTENPKKAFYTIHNYMVENELYWRKFANEIDSSSLISPNAIIATDSVKIGKNSLIEDGVIIDKGVIIGDNVIIRSNSVIGSSGFQFLRDDKALISVKTGGLLIINDNVEVQHNCSIDKGIFGGETIIKNSVKMDNFVHIAHDCIIGERTLITAGVKFGGRSVIGKDCFFGINSTISNGLIIGDNVSVSLGSIVTRNVPQNNSVLGNFTVNNANLIDSLKSIK